MGFANSPQIFVDKRDLFRINGRKGKRFKRVSIFSSGINPYMGVEERVYPYAHQFYGIFGEYSKKDKNGIKRHLLHRQIRLSTEKHELSTGRNSLIKRESNGNSVLVCPFFNRHFKGIKIGIQFCEALMDMGLIQMEGLKNFLL